MEKIGKLLWLVLMLQGLTGFAQECPEPVFPQQGDLVPVDVTLEWTVVEGISAYLVQLGTSEGGDEITPPFSTGQSTQFTPPQGLPENSTIYVEIYVFNTLDNSTTLCSAYSFRTESFTSAPECTEMTNPGNGQQNVSVQTDIQWNYSPQSEEYLVSVRSSSGGVLIEEPIMGLSLDPSNYLPDGLPPDEEIFVQIIPRNNRFGSATGCPEFSFRTDPLAILPGCTTIIYPADLEPDVPLSPVIRWNTVDGADGYIVSVGSSPFENDILAPQDVNPVIEIVGNEVIFEILQFEPNIQVFITIIPFNSAGLAIDCIQTSFFTSVECGPFRDFDGNLVDLSPPLEFAESVGICHGQETILDATAGGVNEADGYRWYFIPPFDDEELRAEGPDFLVPAEGEYRLEIYNEFTGPNGPFECASSQVFTVSQSEAAVIERTDVDLGVGVISIEVQVSGIGDYEFALDNQDGPYQDSNRFTDIPIDNYRIYVRDKNGCGITETLVEPDLTLEGFPKFFTPNGDDINDLWRFIPPPSGVNPIRELFIYDRYGKLLAQVDPMEGWDGNFNGQPMPSSDYWFRAIDNSNKIFQGHFSLKR